MRVDELLLGFHVDLAGHGVRLLPVESDAVHQLDQSGAAIVEPEPIQDELPDFGGRRRQHLRRPGAQFVDLEGRQPSGSALQVEQDDRLDAAFLEFLEPDADGRVVEEQRFGDLGVGPALVEQKDGIRPADDAMLLQPVPDDLHQVGPIRCAEEIAIRLHQATGIDPAEFGQTIFGWARNPAIPGRNRKNAPDQGAPRPIENRPRRGGGQGKQERGACRVADSTSGLRSSRNDSDGGRRAADPIASGSARDASALAKTISHTMPSARY